MSTSSGAPRSGSTSSHRSVSTARSSRSRCSTGPATARSAGGASAARRSTSVTLRSPRRRPDRRRPGSPAGLDVVECVEIGHDPGHVEPGGGEAPAARRDERGGPLHLGRQLVDVDVVAVELGEDLLELGHSVGVGEIVGVAGDLSGHRCSVSVRGRGMGLVVGRDHRGEAAVVDRGHDVVAGRDVDRATDHGTRHGPGDRPPTSEGSFGVECVDPDPAGVQVALGVAQGARRVRRRGRSSPW